MDDYRGDARATEHRTTGCVSRFIGIRAKLVGSIHSFTVQRSLPNDTKEAEKVRTIAARFRLSEDGRPYRLSFERPYILCLHPSKTAELLAELHEEVCGGHSGGRSLTHRAMTQGFWWLNMQQEAIEYVQRCDRC